MPRALTSNCHYFLPCTNNACMLLPPTIVLFCLHCHFEQQPECIQIYYFSPSSRCSEQRSQRPATNHWFTRRPAANHGYTRRFCLKYLPQYAPCLSNQFLSSRKAQIHLNRRLLQYNSRICILAVLWLLLTWQRHNFAVHCSYFTNFM